VFSFCSWLELLSASHFPTDNRKVSKPGACEKFKFVKADDTGSLPEGPSASEPSQKKKPKEIPTTPIPSTVTDTAGYLGLTEMNEELIRKEKAFAASLQKPVADEFRFVKPLLLPSGTVLGCENLNRPSAAKLLERVHPVTIAPAPNRAVDLKLFPGLSLPFFFILIGLTVATVRLLHRYEVDWCLRTYSTSRSRTGKHQVRHSRCLISSHSDLNACSPVCSNDTSLDLAFDEELYFEPIGYSFVLVFHQFALSPQFLSTPVQTER
jgi:hypothetical protein